MEKSSSVPVVAPSSGIDGITRLSTQMAHGIELHCLRKYRQSFLTAYIDKVSTQLKVSFGVFRGESHGLT